MPTPIRVLLARIRGFFDRQTLDRELDEELAAHLAMAEDDKVRQGMSRAEARRRARAELGGVTQVREAARDMHGLPWIDTFWLDIKLGLRMLRKSWGLTTIGGLAMAVAMFIALAVFTFLELSVGGTLPLDEGERIVAARVVDANDGRRLDLPLHELDRWRATVRSLVDLGAYQTVERNRSVGDGLAEPVDIAEMTASGFRVARVAPQMGRTLVDEDERSGATPVVVIGHDVWQTTFAGDPAVVGRTLRLGRTVYTIVGVMPKGFAFPVNHRYWTALGRDRTDRVHGPLDSAMFGRLAPGVTLDEARAELAVRGVEPFDDPTVVAEVTPKVQVMRYTYVVLDAAEQDQARWIFRIVLVFVTLLLVPPCANIAILVYARTVTRQEEFAARHALGASRRRIVAQLFIEMLVLAVLSAGVALVLLALALGWLERRMVQEAIRSEVAFWIEFAVSSRAVLFAGLLAVIAAAVAGLLPALEATGRPLRSGLHALGSRTGFQLGATWTALVVLQVGLSLAVLPSVVELAWGTVRPGMLGPGFAAERYLTASLALDDVGPADREPERFAAVQARLVRSLVAEPNVSGATVAAVPGDEPWRRFEAEGRHPETGVDNPGALARTNEVDEAFFDVLAFGFLTGRGFEAGDFRPAADGSPARVVINRTMSERLFGDSSPLGRRVRPARRTTVSETAAAPAPWLEIIGVVEDRPAHDANSAVYLPAAAGAIHPASLTIRVDGEMAMMSGRLRRIATSLDPTLRIDDVQTLEAIYDDQEVGNNMGAISLSVITLSVLLLSAAGMYALMAFTVNQRRREIGIRSALGARPDHLLVGMFRRVAFQLGAGAAGGVVLAALLAYFLPAEALGGWNVPGVIPAATAFMVLVGLCAAIGPARRGLRVDPIEELRNG